MKSLREVLTSKCCNCLDWHYHIYWSY